MFSVSVLHDERIVVVAEQRPDASEEDSFQWMSRVLQVHNHSTQHKSVNESHLSDSCCGLFQAIDSIHHVGVYCLALVPANTLPKAPLGGIHISETKQRFLEGALHPCNVLMCPHTCVTNLPKPRQKQPGTGQSLHTDQRQNTLPSEACREDAHTRVVYDDVCVSEVGPASMMVGNLVAGKRMAQASGRDVSQLEDTEQVHITHMHQV